VASYRRGILDECGRANGTSQTFTVSIVDPGSALAGMATYVWTPTNAIHISGPPLIATGNAVWFEVYYSLVSPVPSPINYPALVTSGIAGTTVYGCAAP
jgi:hypothetical protein